MSTDFEHSDTIGVITIDEDAPNPRSEFDNISELYLWHDNLELGDEHHFSPQEFLAYKSQNPQHFYVPVYLYQHFGLALSTTPFGCMWDSGQVGWALITDKNMAKFDKCDYKFVEDLVKAELRTYEDYLNGQVYNCEIKLNGEIVDSVSGVYGFEYAKELIKTVLERHAG
jgi:hypothetical protein